MLVRDIGYQVKGRIDNSAEALEAILLDPPDLVLMDIQIKGRQSGLEVAERVKDKKVPILFISSMDDQTVYERARATNFMGYLVKPVGKFSIRTAIELAIRNISGTQQVIEPKGEIYANQDFLYFKKKGIFYKITIADILYIQADNDQTITITNAQKYYSFLSLRALETILSKYRFLRIHRSYLVNLQKISSIDLDNQLVRVNGIQVPFSRRMKKDLLRELPFT